MARKDAKAQSLLLFFAALRLCEKQKRQPFPIAFPYKYQKAYANFLSRFSLMASKKPSVVR